MSKTIQLAATLPATPDRLFDMYLDAEEHSAFTGAPASISPVHGAPFSAFGGVLSGTILQVIPKRLIVQSWRSPHWGQSDLDSTLILTFLPDKEGGRIELAQVNVVDSDFAGVSHGWEKYYWTPWRAYLERGKSSGV
jgi:activator of HSP90 ATPase